MTGLEGADDIVFPHTLARPGSAVIILVTGAAVDEVTHDG